MKPGEDGDTDERREHGTEFDGRPIDLPVLLGFRLDTSVRFSHLGGEALDGRDPAEVVGEDRIESARLVTYGGVPRGDGLLEPHRTPDDERDGKKRHPGDVGSQPEEGDPDRHHARRHLPEVVGAHIEETFELIHVVVHGGHELTGGPIFEVLDVEVLHVPVGVHAQFMLNGLGEVSPGDLMQILEQGLETPDDEGEDRNGEDLIPRFGKAPAGEKRTTPVRRRCRGRYR